MNNYLRLHMCIVLTQPRHEVQAVVYVRSQVPEMARPCPDGGLLKGRGQLGEWGAEHFHGGRGCVRRQHLLHHEPEQPAHTSSRQKTRKNGVPGCSGKWKL